jgi:hypothetical protein
MSPASGHAHESSDDASIEVAKQAQADTTEKARRGSVSSNANQLGGFAQSMNLLFGRSANAGLLEENKRQTEWLRKIHENTNRDKRPKANPDVVFA